MTTKDRTEQVARLIAVRDATAWVLYGQCQCCWTDCDCGCSVFCPVERHRLVNPPEVLVREGVA